MRVPLPPATSIANRFELIGGQNHHELLHAQAAFGKAAQGMQQYWLPKQFQELLRLPSAHARAAAASHKYSKPI